MSENKVIITLISVGQAKIGSLFIHRGAGAKCSECKYFNICVKNLEPNRIYKITGLRNNVLKCDLYEVDMRVVEVIEEALEAAIPAKQCIEGAIIIFNAQKCHHQNCRNMKLCLPEGLMDGDKCRVVKVYGGIQCPMGFQLRMVLLSRVSPSA